MNLEKAKLEFIKYTQNYDLENENIERKQLHSLRVMDISNEIAKALNLEQEEIDLATLIGLLHDIARFEQYIQFKTYKDLQSFDHGDYGAQILAKDIRKYIEIDEFDDIIIKSVKNHNKFKIEDGLTETEELYAKIIRDADKIDILYETVEMFWKGKESEVENSIISEDVIQQIKDKSQIKLKLKESPVDNIMKFVAFIFDINFKTSFELLKKEDYINKILNRYNFKDEYTKQKVEEIRIIANKYINEKIKEG